MVWRLDLATGLSREFKLRANDLANLGLLSCSATAGMMLQLLACLACVQLLAACKPRATREIQSQVPASLHNLEHFFTLSHTLSLHNFHLNTGLLIAKIQANLVWNKANKIVEIQWDLNFTSLGSLKSYPSLWFLNLFGPCNISWCNENIMYQKLKKIIKHFLLS